MRVIFQNDGLIDIRGIQFLGLNAKETDNPIGYFGTGLKYAIAILLREKQQIEVWRGYERFEFSLRRETVRGKEFDLIYMNDQPLGITTEFGKNWEMWQAFRELYSNTLDEAGDVTDKDVQFPSENKTFVVVTGNKFHDAYQNRREIFLESRKTLFETTVGSVLPGQSAHAYYKGIRVNNLGRAAMYTYNITEECDLTEDRTLAHNWEMNERIQSIILEADDEDFLRKVMRAPDFTLEASLSFDTLFAPSESFMKVAEELGALANEPVRRKFKKHQPNGKAYEDYTPSNLELELVERCKKFCAAIGFPITKPIVYVDTLGPGHLGRAENGKIILSKEIFMEGAKNVAHGLLEEQMHLQTGYADMTRALQSFLFKVIIGLGEKHVTKELL